MSDEKTMVCPFLKAGTLARSHEDAAIRSVVVGLEGACREECALNVQGKCAIRVIAESLLKP